MKLTFYRRSLLLALVVPVLSCAKETGTPVDPATGTDFFISGRGLRKIWGMESAGAGLGAFQLQDLTVTSDGYLHTVFSYGVAGVNGSPAQYTNYRRKISTSNGDTVATSGFPSVLRSKNVGDQTVGCAPFLLVPYTDVLAYYENGSIAGTPNWQPVSFAGGEGFSKAYGSRDAACFSTYNNVFDGLPHVIAQLANNGVGQPLGDKVLGRTTLNASVELSAAGVPLTFVIGRNDSLSVYNYNSAALLSTVRLPMIAQYIPANVLPSYRPDVFMLTRRNRAGTKVIGLIYNRSANICSTFIYDIASNTFAIKLQNARLDANLYLGPTETFDDDGNVYYASRFAQTQISRITPAGGDEVYRSGFISTTAAGQVIAIRHVDGRLYAALQSPGNSIYTDSRGRGKLVIAVVE